MVMLTRVVVDRSPDTCPLSTLPVVAPEHATDTKLRGVCAPAHCSGNAFALRWQLPLPAR
jgi:hypothetical protein